MSLQGSADYHALQDAASLEKRVEKAMQARHGRPFNATIRSAQVEYVCLSCRQIICVPHLLIAQLAMMQLCSMLIAKNA